MKKRTPIIAAAVFAALMAAIAVIAAATQLGTPARHLTQLEDPQKTVTEFFSALNQGDFAAADELLGNCVLTNTELRFDSSVNEKLVNALLASISFEFSGECEVTGMDARQPIRLTYFDISSASEQLNVLAREQLTNISDDEYDGSIYDENGTYQEGFIMFIFERAVDELLSSAQDYYVVREFDLVLFYEDSSWRIESSDELLSCIFGGLQ